MMPVFQIKYKHVNRLLEGCGEGDRGSSPPLPLPFWSRFLAFSSCYEAPEEILHTG